MRVIEERIVKKMKDIKENDFHTHNLSCRDTVFQMSGEIYYKLHLTTVIILKRGKSVWVNAGNWETITTKSRINAILEGIGIRDGLYQKDFYWYWRDGTAFYNGDSFFYTKEKGWERQTSHHEV